MNYLMTNKEFVEKLKNMLSHKTVYMWGTFGHKLTEKLIANKSAQYPDYYTSSIQSSLRSLLNKNYFATDCVGEIKGILWGWNGDLNKAYGGASYAVNEVSDTNVGGMLDRCTEVSSDFSDIEIGEAVFLHRTHIGVYIGDGKVIEATPIWENGVQITACKNIGTISGLHSRAWTNHGKLPWIDYTKEVNVVENVSGYAQEAWKWAKENGINDGVGAKNNVTEEQLMVFLKRYDDYLNKKTN